MSIALPSIDLSTVTVGTSGTLNWQNVTNQSVAPVNHGPRAAHLYLFNESGCTLTLQFQTGESTQLPSGCWIIQELQPACVSVTYTVVHVMPNAQISLLLATWYAPGESTPSGATLGNSPIGGSVTSNTANVLQGVGQTNHVTEIDDQFGDAIIVPATGNIQPLSIAARDASGVPVVCFVANYDGTAGMTNVHMGAVLSVNGDTTFGNGVPAIIKLVQNQIVTVTTQQTLATYTTPNDGLKHTYRVSGHLLLANGTSGNFVSVRVDYTGPDGAAYTNVLASSGAFASAAMIIFGGAVSQANGSYALDSLTITVNPNTTISLGYRDPGNTPNDHITMVLERLS